jgi:hypothetical protein
MPFLNAASVFFTIDVSTNQASALIKLAIKDKMAATIITEMDEPLKSETIIIQRPFCS